MKFLQFVAFLGDELAELWQFYRAGKADQAAADQIAMRMSRKVADEIALREIPGP